MIQRPLEQAAALLPMELRAPVLALPERRKMEAEELRLRVGYPLSVTGPEGEREAPGGPAVRGEDLRTVLELASQSSVHTVLDRLRGGFVTVCGGHRIGLCGTVRTEGGRITGFGALTSLNIRIAHEIRGSARAVAPQLMGRNGLESTLILAPPGGGKTTLLRDLIRCLSDGDGVPVHRVGVADERGELAGIWAGEAQMSLGRHTDVLDGGPKAQTLLMLLRGMNPQVLAVDEITHPADVEALTQAAGCGVALLATAHGNNVKDISFRPVYRQLLRRNIFRRVIRIDRGPSGERRPVAEELPCCG